MARLIALQSDNLIQPRSDQLGLLLLFVWVRWRNDTELKAVVD